MLWTLRDGKVLFAETFPSPSEGLRETGLEVLDFLREINNSISRSDLQAASTMLHPDVVWDHNPGVGSLEEGTYRGRESVLELFARIVEPWQRMDPHPDRIQVLGEGTFLLTGHLRAKHATSEMVVEAPYEQEIEVRDGLLVRGRMVSGGMSLG